MQEKVDAPEGFTFERADADRDAETIHRLWKTALDLEITKWVATREMKKKSLKKEWII